MAEFGVGNQHSAKLFVRNSSGNWDFVSDFSGSQGIQGPTGAQGIQGPQGIQGDVGERGIQGIQGIQGVKGDTGAKGDTGDQGPQGLQGIQGPQGLKGDTGAQGIQGIQGPQGIKGIDGNAFQWSFSNSGSTPSQSFNSRNSSGSVTLTKYQAKYFYINEKASCGNVIGQGANNTSAEQEATGWFGIFNAGDTLLVRSASSNGDFATYSLDSKPSFYKLSNGLSYVKLTVTPITIGTASTSFSNSTTYNISITKKGALGATGPTGAQGIQGVKGDTGAQGIQGVKGDTGAQGPQGLKGDTGDRGPQGIQGIQGLKGDTGNTGAVGATGATGPRGLQGPKVLRRHW